MRDTPNCKICKLKCHGCTGYQTCGMRQDLNGFKIEDCTLMASRYYMFKKYLENPSMQLCRFEDECKSVLEAWI